MKMKNVKRLLASMLAAVTVTAALSGCGQTEVNSEETKGTESTVQSGAVETDAAESTETVIDKSKLPTLSLYPANASLASGLVEGWRSDFFAENGFQLEVWAHSADKTNAILASGDLPDIMYVQKGEQLDALIEGGKIIKLEDYMDKLPHLYSEPLMEEAIDIVRATASSVTEEIYGLPTKIGEFTQNYSLLNSTAAHAFKLKWDVYEKIGAPEIKDEYDLIDVMEQMLAAQPTTEDGTKMYGTVLNAGSDNDYWGNMQIWMTAHGYMYNNLKFLLELNFTTDEYLSILEDNSMYYQGLKWYNEVNRRGLMDPDSINTDRATQAKKLDLGLAMVPSGTLTGYAAQGYYEYLIPGTNIYHPAVTKVSNYVLVVNAETEYLDECLALLDMWCDPDACRVMKYGPDGDIWYSDGENAYLTDEFTAWLEAGNAINGYKMSDGTEWSLFNTDFVCNDCTPGTYKDGKGNARTCSPQIWTEFQEIGADTELYAQWRETTGQNSWREWLASENAFYGDPEYDNIKKWVSSGPEDANLQLVQSACKDVIVNASWNMVYAETEAEFEALWDQMVKDANEAGAQDLIKWRLDDIAQAREKNNQ